MEALAVTHGAPIIGVLWVLSWLGAMAFNSARTNSAQK
jgi:hypothetical protein